MPLSVRYDAFTVFKQMLESYVMVTDVSVVMVLI
jgi:hypothetical protein